MKMFLISSAVAIFLGIHYFVLNSSEQTLRRCILVRLYDFNEKKVCLLFFDFVRVLIEFFVLCGTWQTHISKSKIR